MSKTRHHTIACLLSLALIAISPTALRYLRNVIAMLLTAGPSSPFSQVLQNAATFIGAYIHILGALSIIIFAMIHCFSRALATRGSRVARTPYAESVATGLALTFVATLGAFSVLDTLSTGEDSNCTPWCTVLITTYFWALFLAPAVLIARLLERLWFHNSASPPGADQNRGADALEDARGSR